MEKIKLGMEMATRWTDPTIILILLVPYSLAFLGFTGYFIFDAAMTAYPYASTGVLPVGDALTAMLTKLALIFMPCIFSYMWFCGLYYSFFEEKGVDTSKFVTFRDAGLGKYYKHRRIPICELYELYMEEKCDFNEECEGGDCYKILAYHRDEFVTYKTTWRQLWWLLVQFLPKWMTCGSGLGYGSSSGKSIEETTKEIDEHYNKGNDVFSCILGKSMVYTCGIFHSMPTFASTSHKDDFVASRDDGELEAAQFNKMSMVCDKLMLKKGETLLDIGCGWGTLLRHAKREYGAEVTGVTLSREGKIYCDLAASKESTPCEILHCDYRLIPQNRKFDKISSIEMAEHVGLANFVDPYLKNVRRLMKNKDSMFLMQVAGLRQGSNWQDVQWGLFMCKYVFPGADASTPLNWYCRQAELAGFEVHSVENIGIHYSHTLHKWYDNWMSHKDEILSGEIDAISEHTKGTHLFRLNEFTWAWCAIHAEQGGGTCYQLLLHPCEYDFPRDQWVTGEHVSNSGVTGVGTDAGFKKSSKKGASTPKKKSSKKGTRVQPPRSSKKTPAK